MIYFSRTYLIVTSFFLLSCGDVAEEASPSLNESKNGPAKLTASEVGNKPEYVSLENEAKWLAHLGLENSSQVKELFAAMRKAAHEDDRNAVAELVCFPFRKMNNGLVEKIYEEKSEFLKDYELLVTPTIYSVLKAANYEDFWANGDGGMMPSGAIWFNYCDGPLKIISLNG